MRSTTVPVVIERPAYLEGSHEYTARVPEGGVTVSGKSLEEVVKLAVSAAEEAIRAERWAYQSLRLDEIPLREGEFAVELELYPTPAQSLENAAAAYTAERSRFWPNDDLKMAALDAPCHGCANSAALAPYPGHPSGERPCCFCVRNPSREEGKRFVVDVWYDGSKPVKLPMDCYKSLDMMHQITAWEDEVERKRAP